MATDRELLERFRRGERAAFTQIVGRHYLPVTRHARSLLSTDEDARDVAQETFLAVWKKVQSIDLVGDSLAPWLKSTAWHIAQNHLRSDERRPVATQDEFEDHVRHHESSTEELAEYRYLLGRIARAVAAMPEIDREVYRLCVREGRTYDDVAAELGVDNTAVRNRVSRIRGRLRDRFLAER